MGISGVSSFTPTNTSSQLRFPPDPQPGAVAAESNGIIDVGDLPDGIIDVGDLPDGVSANGFDRLA